ncbi:MAG: hypothetical protein LCH81_20315 [Bacteroidetes bacterium]|nr:hypothetical protein [Bacteroidota bacterium]
MDKIDVPLAVFTSNIESLISIYNDSEKIRQLKKKELEDSLNVKSWSDKEFNEYSHYAFHFDWLLLQSLFVSAFSYFENYMESIAKFIESTGEQKIKIKDIKGDGILDTYRKYLYLIGNVEKASNGKKEWQKLNDFKKVRNIITHAYGKLDKEFEILKKHDIYYGPSKRMIRIKNINFVKDFVVTSTSYMNEIAIEVKKIYGG